MKKLATASICVIVLFFSLSNLLVSSFRGSEVLAAGYVTVDIRNYITVGTLGWRRLQDCNVQAQDGTRNAYKQWSMLTTTYGIPTGPYEYYERDNSSPYLFGVYKDAETVLGVLQWRCFANVGQRCEASQADYPPQGVPLVMQLPRLPASALRLDQVTPGATLIPEYSIWRAVDVRNLNAGNCDNSYAWTMYHQVYAFVVDQMDFGGDLGISSDILVIQEAETNSPSLGMQRLETYIYARNWGRVQQSGYQNGLSSTVWNRRISFDNTPGPICPFKNGSW